VFDGVFSSSWSRRKFLKSSVAAGAGLLAAPSILDILLGDPAFAALSKTVLDAPTMDKLLSIAMARGGEYAEVFVEYNVLNGVSLEENKIRQAQYGIAQGVGIRVLKGEQTGYAYSDEFDFDKLKEAADVASYIAGNALIGTTPMYDVSPRKTKSVLKVELNPNDVAVKDKIAILRRANDTARKEDPRIIQVNVSMYDTHRAVQIATTDGVMTDDYQVMTRLNVTTVVEEKDDRQTGYHGGGGRVGIEHYKELTPEMCAKEAVRQAVTKLGAAEAPAGPQVVVLGNGWAGILLHESIGHGLEADFNRKKTSLYSGRIGEKVASDMCTVIDEGNIIGRRGSIGCDDEGEPSRKNVLIENGILRGYMCDKLNAKLMGMESTGSGRRQSFKHYPMPRMTNTYMLPGKYTPEEVIASVEKGFYAKSFGGGQVDISNGNFVFNVTEGYLIENGKITRPVKGANLIGIGPQVLENVEMVANDLELDTGVGTCGKNGQSVPVGVGLPTCKISEITVGGTDTQGRSTMG